MPRRCVVIGCTTNRDFYEPGIRFFQFPHGDERLRVYWRKIIGRDETWKVPKLASICQRHFLPADITADRRLTDSAVPTLNLPPGVELHQRKSFKATANCKEKENMEINTEYCLQQQKQLVQLYCDRFKSKFEDFPIKTESAGYYSPSEHEFEQVMIPEHHPDSAAKVNGTGQLPTLTGLSVDEMIAVLDDIPTKNKRISATPPEECWDCGQQFPNLSRKKKHRKTCSAIGTPESLRNKHYKCEICNKEISTRSGYRVHLTKIHCNTNESTKTSSEELMRMQEKKRLQCPLCPNKYYQVHQLKYHLKTHQSKSLCKKKYKKAMLPEGKRICPICGKNFERNPFYFETHMKFHRKEKDFQCDQCEKAYFTKHDLRNHKSTIHASHTLLCGYCGKSFGTRQAFTRHQLIHDNSTNSYHCTFCPKSYPTAGSLKYHVMKHTGEKDSKCELCGHEFRFRYMLTQHLIRTHNIEIEGVKLYKRKVKTTTPNE
ncbi:zinc finger protein 540-like [Sabethes cyaneus]|uniref:zinc finger protein 540-like n=1 Tax=Sabethes cyaneus TaxID=53552 RepID=UPI00237E3B01|nr:zinc finger protein 540-like [Sabethes cyaneus]